jgi:hypothetical protein
MIRLRRRLGSLRQGMAGCRKASCSVIILRSPRTPTVAYMHSKRSR